MCPDSPIIGIHQLLNTQTPTKMRKPQPKIHIIHQLNQTIKATKETNQTYQSYHESHKNQLTSHHRPPRLGVPGIAHHEAEALTKSGLRNTGSKVIGKSYPYCVVYRTCFIKSCIYRLMCLVYHTHHMNIILYIICMHMYNIYKRWYLHGFVPFLDLQLQTSMKLATPRHHATSSAHTTTRHPATKTGRD